MSLGRLFALLIVLVLGWWVITRSGLLASKEPEAAESKAPIERAREVARGEAQRNAARETAQSALDSGTSGGQITENMTPDQVRALLGPPSETQTETTESGATREKWIYSTVGKTVVFENGIVVSIQ